MSQAMFQAQVMDQLKQQDEKEVYVGCVYCGEPKGDSLSCCDENHFEEMEYE